MKEFDPVLSFESDPTTTFSHGVDVTVQLVPACVGLCDNPSDVQISLSYF